MESLNSPSKPQFEPFSHISSFAAPHVGFSVENENITNITKPDFSRFHQKNRDSAQLQKSALGSIAEYPSAREKAKSEPTPAQLKKRAKYRRLKTAAKLLPNERIAGCQKYVSPEFAYFTVKRNPVDGCTGFNGFVACESASCPHCVQARSERDRHELMIALAAAKKRGWSQFMLTLTLRHTTYDPLAELQSTVANAFDRCFSGRFYQDLKAEYRVQTKVKGWETRYGNNGWHPHLHLLFFYEGELSSEQVEGLRKWVGQRWLETLKKLGGSATMEYGISIETADSKIAEYIAKWGKEPNESSWGAEAEMTKGHLKKAKDESSLTPFELLGAAAGEADQLERLQRIFSSLDGEALRNRAGQLYVEYFRAFKGKARLHWGQTKELLNLDDELHQFAQDNPPVEDESYCMVMIDRHEASKVTGGFKGDDLRAELLEVCSDGNPYELQSWLKQHDIAGIIPDVAWEQFNQLGGRAWQSPGDGWSPAAGGRLL